ncbi:hypothetical protein PFISCL1PPCAC_3664, partial [Pristionchus fissidentatus]
SCYGGAAGRAHARRECGDQRARRRRLQPPHPRVHTRLHRAQYGRQGYVQEGLGPDSGADGYHLRGGVDDLPLHLPAPALPAVGSLRTRVSTREVLRLPLRPSLHLLRHYARIHRRHARSQMAPQALLPHAIDAARPHDLLPVRQLDYRNPASDHPIGRRALPALRPARLPQHPLRLLHLHGHAHRLLHERDQYLRGSQRAGGRSIDRGHGERAALQRDSAVPHGDGGVVPLTVHLHPAALPRHLRSAVQIQQMSGACLRGRHVLLLGGDDARGVGDSRPLLQDDDTLPRPAGAQLPLLDPAALPSRAMPPPSTAQVRPGERHCGHELRRVQVGQPERGRSRGRPRALRPRPAACGGARKGRREMDAREQPYRNQSDAQVCRSRPRGDTHQLPAAAADLLLGSRLLYSIRTGLAVLRCRVLIDFT